jgi:hypothetical protein
MTNKCVKHIAKTSNSKANNGVDNELRTCEGPKCNTYKTQDRLRGTGDNKHYESRRARRLHYLNRFCSQQCTYDAGLKNKHIKRARLITA